MIGVREAAPALASAAAQRRPLPLDVVDCVVSVKPVGGGWCVAADACGEPLMFLSGKCAEEHARGLSRRIARIGCDVRLDVYDRRGLPAGSVRFFADGF